MSQWVRNILFLLGGVVAIFLVAYAVAALIAALYTGTIVVPAVTQNNIWSIISMAILTIGGSAVTLAGLRLRELIQLTAQQSHQNSQKLDQTIETVAEIKHTVENGGGAGTKEIKTIVAGIAQKLERDPNSRDRATDGGAS